MTGGASHGVLVVDKPRGPTSFDIVAQTRRLFGTRSVGHAGTLDPMATGVLVVLVGEATKLSAYLTQADKSYLATIRFGASTDTLDAEGQVIERSAVPRLEPQDIERALEGEFRRTQQLPPAFSAIKVSGKSAHRLARAGKPVELEPRPVRVRRLDCVTMPQPGTPELVVRLDVSKGYYVRSFARDVAKSLGVPGHLCGLRRLASGRFSLTQALAWPVETAPELLSMAEAVRRALPWRRVTPEGELRARQGKRLTQEHFDRIPPPGISAWLGDAGKLVALGQPASDGFAVVRGFNH